MTNSLEIANICKRSYGEFSKKFAGGVAVLKVDNVIAFRGTEFDGRDILRDIRAIPWHDPDLGWCHAGFLKGVRDGECWEWLADHITRETILGGHSLGGAQACIVAGLAIKRLGVQPRRLVTYGAPRPGYGQLRHILGPIDKDRYVNGRDCVPSHPWPLWGYMHPNRAQNVRSVGGGGPFTDHKIDNYINGLGFPQVTDY